MPRRSSSSTGCKKRCRLCSSSGGSLERRWLRNESVFAMRILNLQKVGLRQRGKVLYGPDYLDVAGKRFPDARRFGLRVAASVFVELRRGSTACLHCTTSR